MQSTEIIEQIKKLESSDIYELLNNRGIHIVHRPDLFTFTNSDARIITDIYGNTWIFLSFADGENPVFENFVLWHELGHIETRGRSVTSRAFDYSTHDHEEEVEANTFAFLALISKMKKIPSCMMELAHVTGIPYIVLSELMSRLRRDEAFMNYLMRKK